MELTSCREIAFASREFLTRLFERRQGPWRDVEFLFAAPNSRYAFSTVSNDDRPPLRRSRRRRPMPHPPPPIALVITPAPF